MTRYVRAIVPRPNTYDLSMTTGAALAEKKGWRVVDEPTHQRDGRIRPATRANGRPAKPHTTVAKQAAKKTTRKTTAAKKATAKKAATSADKSTKPTKE